MQVSDNFVRANNPSLGLNWSAPVAFNGAGVGAGGMQLLNNAFAPITTAGASSMSIWAGAGAGTFANDQYAQASISALAVFTSVVAISAATFSAGNTTYNYTLSSGSALVVQQEVYITGMGHAGNNGVFQIASLGGGTFTVVNANGVTATEAGTGTSPSDSNCGLVVRGTSDGQNGYLLFIGTNSGLVASGGLVDSRTQDVELWKVVGAVGTFMSGGGGGIGTSVSLSVNDVWTLIVSGTTISVMQNNVVVFKTTDSSLSSGSPGIMTWSVGPPGEWATPTTYGVGNSGTQMTNWIGGDDNYIFNQLASDSLTEGTALTQVASDGFTRANGGLGSNWVSSVGGLQIASNKVEATATGVRSAAYWGGGQTFNNDQYAEATIAVINNTSLGGPMVRSSFTGVSGTTGETGYILLIPATGVSGSIIVQKLQNGGATTNFLTIPTITPNIGDTFRISAVGTTITVFKNGVSIGSAVDATLTKGFPGIWVLAGAAITDCQFSSWAAGGTGVPTTFSARPNQSWMSSSVSGASPNVLDSSATPYASFWQNVVSWPADQFSECKLTGSGAGTGPAVRISTTADTSYSFIVGSGSTAKLLKYVAGVLTTLATSAYTFVSGDIFRIEIKGNTIICKINGIIQSMAIDNSIASGNAGLVGLTAAATCSVSNWDAGGFSTVYSYPDDRLFGIFPNHSRNVQGTLICDVVPAESRVAPNIPVDSRLAPNIPVDSRISPNAPQNSRNTPS